MPAPAAELQVEALRVAAPGFTLAAEFRLAAGERAGLVGRSGVGKTTLLKTLAGLLPFQGTDSGTVRVGGLDVTRLPPQKRNIGFIFQDQQLFQALDVLDNAVFGLRARGVAREQADASGREWLARVGLEDRARAPVSALSGGERQRVAWVRALIWKPALLLLDEPFSALDPGLKQALRQELKKLLELAPVPLILVGHDERDAETLAPVRLAFRESAGVREVFRA